MANAGDIYLGLFGSETLLPAMGREYSFEDQETLREQRAFSGRLTQETLYTKKQFTLDYSYVDSTTLSIFRTLYNFQTELSLKIYETAEIHNDYTVVMRPIKAKRVLLNTINGGLWSGVTVTLVEV